MERNTDVNRTSVGKNAVILTGSKILVSMLGIITAMLLARFRTLEEYGTYSQIIMVADLVSSILLLGLPNSINYFLAKEDETENRQKFLSVYYTLSTIMTIIIAICLLLALPIIVRYFSNSLIKKFAYVFVIYPWASLMINSLSNACIVYGKMRKLLYFNVTQSIATLFILLMAKILGLSFQIYMYFYMASLFVFAVVGVLWVRSFSGRIVYSLDWELIQRIFVFSIPIGLASVVGTITIQLDKIVIGRFFSTEQYAIFANASKELPVTLVATSLTAVLLPALVKLLDKEEKQNAVELWGYAASISFCFMALVVGGFLIFAPDIMSLFYSEKYVTTAGVAVFRIYTLILLFKSIYWGIFLNALGKTKFILYTSILTLIFNFIGNIVFYHLIGFIGPAISSLLVIGIMAFVQLRFTGHLLNVPIKRILPWKNFIVNILQTLILGVIFAVLKYRIFDCNNRNISITISISMGVVWAVIYGLINLKSLKESWKKLNS